MASKPLTFTKDDLHFLRSKRISPADVCETCKGAKCRDCHFTGVQPPTTAPKPSEEDTEC